MSDQTHLYSQFIKLIPVLNKMDLNDIGRFVIVLCSSYCIIKDPTNLVKIILVIITVLFGIIPIAIYNTRTESSIDVIYCSNSRENNDCDDDTNTIGKNLDDLSFMNITELKMFISQLNLDLHIVNNHFLKKKIIGGITRRYNIYLTFFYFSDQLNIVSNLEPKSLDTVSGDEIKEKQRYIVTQQILKDTFNCGITIFLKNFRDNPKEIRFCLELEPVRHTHLHSLCAAILNGTLFYVQKKIVIHH